MLIYFAASTPSPAQKISIERSTLVELTKQAEIGQQCCQLTDNLRVGITAQQDSTATYQATASRLASTLAITQAKLNRWRLIAIALAAIIGLRLLLYARKILPI